MPESTVRVLTRGAFLGLDLSLDPPMRVESRAAG
jgi:hypothetical protein